MASSQEIHELRIEELKEEKAQLQREIEWNQELIAEWQSDLENPSTDEGERPGLEEAVQDFKAEIKSFREQIASVDASIEAASASKRGSDSVAAPPTPTPQPPASSGSDSAATVTPPSPTPPASSELEEYIKHMKAYKKAIKENLELLIRVVRFNNIGLPRSGKTSFRRRIMGKILNILAARERGEKEQSSTGVAEAGGQVFIKNKISSDLGTISSKTWSVIENLEEEAKVVGQLLRGKDLVENAFTDTPTNSLPDRASSEQLGLHLKALSSLTKGVHYVKNEEAFTDSEIEEMLGIIGDAMDGGEDQEKVKRLLEDLILLINTDMGGQAEFLDIHASLIQGPSFNLLFSRLVDELDSNFEVCYVNEKGESTKKEKSIMTVEDVLFQSLSSIACYSGVFCDDDNASPVDASGSKPGIEFEKHCKSKVLFVGTYRDMVSQKEFKKKDKLLREKVEKTEFYEKDIIEFVSPDQLMLAVNNMSGGQDEIDRIRKVLEKIIEKSFKKISIPASWFVLSLHIRSKIKTHEKRTMSLEQCEELGRKVGICPSDLQHALWFLHHQVGVILYYPEIPVLKGTVICDIQIVFDSATNLIKNVFTFDNVGKRLSERFREKAQFSLKDVQKATSDHTDDLISLDKLVQLLKYLCVLTVIPSSTAQEPTYFMPCVLKSARLSIPSYSDSDPAPLMLRYDCGYVPVGIFPSMITNLVSQQREDWELIEEGLCKNKVQFLVGEDHDTVTLISRPRYFEIVVPRNEVSLCSHVREVIRSTLRTVTSHMNYHFSMGYKFGFECPTHPGREHLCVLVKESAKDMLCLENPKKKQYVRLESRHKVWFSEYLSPAKNKFHLDIEFLTLFKWKCEEGVEREQRIAKTVSAVWKELGRLVGLGSADIERFDRMERLDNYECCIRVFTSWIENDGHPPKYPLSWEGLCDLLQDVKHAAVVRDVQAALGI